MKDPLQMLRSSIAMAAESGETEINSYTSQLLLNWNANHNKINCVITQISFFSLVFNFLPTLLYVMLFQMN